MRPPGWLPPLVAVGVLHLALALPATPDADLLRLAPELPVLVLAACLGLAGRGLGTGLLAGLVVQKNADLALF